MKPSIAPPENPEPDEEKLFQDFAGRVLARMDREKDRENLSKPMRGFHAKIHLGVRATFKVMEDLPEFAQRGVFAEGGRTYEAVVRFSNGEPRRNADTNKEPRGIGIKLLNVPGEKVADHKGQPTQDFLATSHSLTSIVRNARQFIDFIDCSEPKFLLPIKLPLRVGLSETMRIFKGLSETVLKPVVSSMATETYKGTAPIRFGEFAVKFFVGPAKGTALSEMPKNPERDFLKTDLVNRLEKGELRFDFSLQFYVDDESTPLEDTSRVWNVQKSPLVKVAELVIPRWSMADPEKPDITPWVEQLSFSPWHALEAFRPIGSIMRARRVAYRASPLHRAAIPEPSAIP